MSHTLNDTEDQQPIGLSKVHQQLVESHLKLSQYNPYRYWLIGHPNEQRRLPVFQIKAAEDFSVCACPELGLTASGPDYLAVQQELHRSILANLGLPRGTPVAVTCAPRFDIHGKKVALTLLTTTPTPDNRQLDTDEPPALEAASTPEPTRDNADANAEITLPSAKAEDEDENNLFTGITGQVDEGDTTDLNDQNQLGLF